MEKDRASLEMAEQKYFVVLFQGEWDVVNLLEDEVIHSIVAFQTSRFGVQICGRQGNVDFLLETSYPTVFGLGMTMFQNFILKC